MAPHKRKPELGAHQRGSEPTTTWIFRHFEFPVEMFYQSATNCVPQTNPSRNLSTTPKTKNSSSPKKKKKRGPPLSPQSTATRSKSTVKAPKKNNGIRLCDGSAVLHHYCAHDCQQHRHHHSDNIPLAETTPQNSESEC